MQVVPGPENALAEELRRVSRALAALRACNQAQGNAASEQELVEKICGILVGIGEYRMSAIGYAMQDEAQRIKVKAHDGHDSGYFENIDLRWSDTPTGRGPAGTAIRENRICVVTDTQQDPAFAPWREAARERGYAAMIALPLRVGGEAFGVLALYSEQAGSFENSEVGLLAEVADVVGYGITAIRTQEENRRATALLREAEARYRQLVEEVPAISYVAETGALGAFVYMSPQVTTILGYRPESCVADTHFWWNHLHPEDRTIAMTEDGQQEGRPFQMEYRMRAQDGREVWIRDEAIVFRDPETGRRMTRGLMLDITERRRAEEALRHSEECYRMFVAQSSEAIFRLEYEPAVPCHLPAEEQLRLARKHGYLAECNDAMAKMYGYATAEELIGKPLLDLWVLNDPVTQSFMEDFIRAGYRTTDQESREVDARGQKKILRNTMIGMVENGHWIRTWGIARDVTAKMHLEEQLRNAQQLEAIGRLAGGVAHDFNNILSIMMGHGELLLAMKPEEGIVKGLEQIQRAATRAASLTQQLLAFSRKQVLQPKVLDLNEAVADVHKMLARVIGEDIELVAKLHPSLAAVKADPGQMEQVLMNLAINARDAMPRGGKLIMETANIDIGVEEARDAELGPGRYVMLRVIDTGEGMNPETVSHIFEPFFTTKARGKGTGLGLATVYGIVKQSGGSIEVQSEPGGGAEFRILLPAAKESPQPALNTPQGKVAGGTETILVVEDEPDLRELTKIFLEGYGYKVVTASSAEQATQMAETLAGPIDLLLTDVVLPRMSGRQLAEKIVARRPETKIVYMTGYTDDMIVQHKVLEPGVNLLQKPFTKLELATKVRTTLDGK